MFAVTFFALMMMGKETIASTENTATWNKKMKTVILGAILILVPNLLDACMRNQGCKAKDPVNLAISMGGRAPWNQFMGGRNLNLGEERKKNKGKKNKQCMDDTEFFEILAFFVCDQDGDQGLTWPEVSECFESHQDDLTKLSGIPNANTTKEYFDCYDLVDGKLTLGIWASDYADETGRKPLKQKKN